jgi:hypothetical protein
MINKENSPDRTNAATLGLCFFNELYPVMHARNGRCL